MKTRILLLSLISLLLSCNSEIVDKIRTTEVLMLKVDYTTHAFEGGTEFNFSGHTDNFTIINEYVEPSDFGSVKLTYKELNETLFDGTIHWMGLGEMTFPKKLKSPKEFEFTITQDFVYPINGFENVFNPQNQKYEYDKVWSSVQNIMKVREYLIANPEQKVKVFLYTPSVGEGDPLDWDWIVYLKK